MFVGAMLLFPAGFATTAAPSRSLLLNRRLGNAFMDLSEPFPTVRSQCILIFFTVRAGEWTAVQQNNKTEREMRKAASGEAYSGF